MKQIRYDQPKLIQHDNGKVELAEDWTVDYGNYRFTVPQGFVSDGNSVPNLWLRVAGLLCILVAQFCFCWMFWVGLVLLWGSSLITKYGRNTLAGIVHDALYRTHKVKKIISGVEFKAGLTRKQADQIRLDICLKCKVYWYQAYLSYFALRLFGWWAWNGARRRDAK